MQSPVQLLLYLPSLFLPTTSIHSFQPSSILSSLGSFVSLIIPTSSPFKLLLLFNCQLLFLNTVLPPPPVVVANFDVHTLPTFNTSLPACQLSTSCWALTFRLALFLLVPHNAHRHPTPLSTTYTTLVVARFKLHNVTQWLHACPSCPGAFSAPV